MTRYWFLLGREPLLSTAELAAVFKLTDYERPGPFLVSELPEMHFESPEAMMARLGGTIKIARELGRSLSEDELLGRMQTELEATDGKIHFGISYHATTQDSDTVYQWGKELKSRLKKAGRSVRHVFNREALLSSVTVAKNGLTKRGSEFLVQESAGTFHLGKTIAVQPFEAFGARDFGRPGRDDVSGMLPPKLALMMLNLAGATLNRVLLDPFCGSGTILTEALLIGCNHIIGSDLSEKAINDTQKNIDWTLERAWRAEELPTALLVHKPVAELSSFVPAQSVDMIVTEPYLGKPLTGRETREFLTSQVTELKKLYLDAFKEFFTLLRPGGRVVFLIPRFKYHGDWMRIDCAEDIRQLGFSVVSLLGDNNFLLYARPDQRVGREVWCFEKTAKT